MNREKQRTLQVCGYSHYTELFVLGIFFILRANAHVTFAFVLRTMYGLDLILETSPIERNCGKRVFTRVHYENKWGVGLLYYYRLRSTPVLYFLPRRVCALFMV